jgi:hypothetical protein
MTYRTRSVASSPRSRSRRLSLALALGAAVVIAPAAVFGEVQVRGTPDAVRIEAQGSSIEDVLTALRKAFDLRWQSPIALDKRIIGTYEGSLGRVLTRVLDGYNFVLKAGEGRLEVSVLGPRGTTAVAAGAPGAGSKAPTVATAPKSLPPAAANAPPKPPATTAPPAPVAAVNKVVDAAPAAPTPTLVSATMVAEGPSIPMPGQGAATMKAPEPMPSSVEPPTPGLGTGAVPELRPSTVLPPGAAPVPDGGTAPSGVPPAPPKT